MHESEIRSKNKNLYLIVGFSFLVLCMLSILHYIFDNSILNWVSGVIVIIMLLLSLYRIKKYLTINRNNTFVMLFVLLVLEITSYCIPFFGIPITVCFYINRNQTEQEEEIDIKLFSRLFWAVSPFFIIGFFIKDVAKIFGFVVFFTVVMVLLAVLFGYIKKHSYKIKQKLNEVDALTWGLVMLAILVLIVIACCVIFVVFLCVFKIILSYVNNKITVDYILKNVDLSTMVSVIVSIIALISTWILHKIGKKEEQLMNLHHESNWRKNLLTFESKNDYTILSLFELNSFINCFNQGGYTEGKFKDNKVNIDQLVNFLIIYVYQLTSRSIILEKNDDKELIYKTLENALSTMATYKNSKDASIELSPEFIKTDFCKKICTGEKLQTIFDFYIKSDHREDEIKDCKCEVLIRMAAHVLLKNDWENIKNSNI